MSSSVAPTAPSSRPRPSRRWGFVHRDPAGNAKWLATCKRLGLPLPPVDPHAPPLFSEWRAVAEWEVAAPRLVLGFREEHAWLTDPEGHVRRARARARVPVPRSRPRVPALALAVAVAAASRRLSSL